MPIADAYLEQQPEQLLLNLERNLWCWQSVSCMDARGGRLGGTVLDLVATVEYGSVRTAGPAPPGVGASRAIGDPTGCCAACAVGAQFTIAVPVAGRRP